MVTRGMRDPFIISVGRISRTIRLETGNHRIRILKDKGVKYVPCVALVSDHGIKHSGNGHHRFKADLLIDCGDPILGPYDEHIYHKPSDVIPDVASMQNPKYKSQAHLGLLDQVLSVIGFPEDNTASIGTKETPWYEHPECFCRDWLDDKWVDHVLEGKMSIQEFILWAQSEVA